MGRRQPFYRLLNPTLLGADLRRPRAVLRRFPLLTKKKYIYISSNWVGPSVSEKTGRDALEMSTCGWIPMTTTS